MRIVISRINLNKGELMHNLWNFVCILMIGLGIQPWAPDIGNWVCRIARTGAWKY